MNDIFNNPHVMSVLGVMFGALVTLLTGFLGFKLQKRDNKMDELNKQNKEKDTHRDNLELMMAAQMLYKNYRDCVEKGYYSLEERKVYHPLYEAYIGCSGNGTIKSLGPIMLAMPTEPPEHPRRRKTDFEENERRTQDEQNLVESSRD